MCTIKRENKDERGYKNNENLCMGWGFKMKRERERESSSGVLCIFKC